ncbi:MAG: HNH endonuclease [Thermodesulfobacteriota bacterium]
MKIDFDFYKCIYCLENDADSWEHIIPESIGGRLEAKILCTDCNNEKLGSKLISKVKTDPSIRLAIRKLKNDIPGLFEAIENNQIYIAKDKNNNVIRLRYKNSKLEIISHMKEDGSLVLDSKKGVKNIKQMLKKDRLSEDEIANKIQSFQKLDHNKVIKLSKSVQVTRWSTGPTFPSLQGPLLDEKIIALIAYEFLSLLLGNLIYDDELNFVREFIKEGTKSEKLVIEHLLSRHHSPYHKIYPELLETEAIINIILFRCLVYKVHIMDFKLSSIDFVYLEDLKNRKTLIARSVDEAKRGIYYGF